VKTQSRFDFGSESARNIAPDGLKIESEAAKVSGYPGQKLIGGKCRIPLRSGAYTKKGRTDLIDFSTASAFSYDVMS
jgi:hypothetical protein